MKKTVFTLLTLMLVTFSTIAQSYDVGYYRSTFRDGERRNRRVATNIYYPEVSAAQAATTFPVVVLGHGFVMGSDAYRNIYNDLVPKGYIVAFVDTEGSFFANHRAFAQDLAFIAEAMQGENTNSRSPIAGMISDKTALMGHSMGGGAATVAATLTDVETLIVMAPALLRFDTLTPATQVTTPALVFSGSGDAVTRPEEMHIPVYQNLGSDCKYFVNIVGGAHCYYANSSWACDFGERSSRGDIQISRTEQQQIVSKHVTAWLDFRLKGDATAEQTFINDLENSSDVTFENGCSTTSNVSDNSSETKTKVAITPNPASTFIQVNANSKKSIEKTELYNQFGELVITSTKQQINVSGLTPGYYVARVYTNNTIVTKKIIIKK